MKILVATGASGGHIFPALSFLETLKEKHEEIETLLVLPKRSIRNQVIPQNLRVKYLPISTIRKSFNLRNFIAIFDFLKGSFESLFLLAEFRPDVVVGFGSLNSIPVLLGGWIFRTGTLIHEQNVIPGRANRLLAKFIDKIAVSFPETKDYLKTDPKRVVVTGNPLRKELKMVEKKEALRFFGLSENKLTILTMGGSQGSHSININFLKAISDFPDKSKLQIIHIAGSSDYDLLEKGYRDSGLSYRLFHFLKEMQYAYSACDFAISRAGATTIAELMNFSVPAIMVPYPFAYAHQLGNAKVLGNLGSAIVIGDEKLDSAEFKRILIGLINNPE